MLAALAGLSAACYLVLRYTEGGRAAVIGASAPAMLAALGFTFVGVLAASFPFELPWLPLLAPLAVFGIYVLATRPFYKAGEGKLEHQFQILTRRCGSRYRSSSSSTSNAS